MPVRVAGYAPDRQGRRVTPRYWHGFESVRAYCAAAGHAEPATIEGGGGRFREVGLGSEAGGDHPPVRHPRHEDSVPEKFSTLQNLGTR